MKINKTRISFVMLMVLAALKDQPAHGYTLMKKLHEGSMGWHVKSGTLYPALHRMVEKGLITGRRIPHESKPDATEYSLTEKGEEVLDSALRKLGPRFRTQGRIWSFLMKRAGKGVTSDLLRHTKHEPNPVMFALMKQHFCCGGPHRASPRFLKRYRQHLKAELEWVDTKLKELSESNE
ncbi:MAG: PadR family transcriptional regulator [Candidatus Thorarchaeota archaeon]